MQTIAKADPFDAEWVSTGLQPLVDRARAGEDPDGLRDELFERLWPWASQLADRMAARLPSSADGNTTRSEILLAVWQATRRIGWDHPDSWLAMLRQRVRGAQVDAARTDDTLSRRLRRAKRELAGAVAVSEQQRGRHLSQTEQADLAADLWPRARPQWVELVLAGGTVPPASAGFDLTPDSSPEERVIDAELRDMVRTWLRRLPPELAEDVHAWLDQRRPRSALPARLRSRLRPYLGDLETLAPPAAAA